jgi:hypothetical protein
MDEGLPIAYPLLDSGIPVLASGGERVGTVHHVVAASDQDIFHGLVITLSGHDRRFVAAEDVAALHERGVDLELDVQAVQALQPPGGSAPVYGEDPTATKWSHWAGKLSGRGDWRRQG